MFFGCWDFACENRISFADALLAQSSDRGITKGGVADRGYAAKALYSVKSASIALLEEEAVRHPPEPCGGERGGSLREAGPPFNLNASLN
jgi:hypothetical protein